MRQRFKKVDNELEEALCKHQEFYNDNSTSDDYENIVIELLDNIGFEFVKHYLT